MTSSRQEIQDLIDNIDQPFNNIMKVQAETAAAIAGIIIFSGDTQAIQALNEIQKEAGESLATRIRGENMPPFPLPYGLLKDAATKLGASMLMAIVSKRAATVAGEMLKKEKEKDKEEKDKEGKE